MQSARSEGSESIFAFCVIAQKGPAGTARRAFFYPVWGDLGSFPVTVAVYSMPPASETL